MDGPALDGSAAPDLLDEARRGLPDAVELRRRMHRRPELGLDLPETQTAVLEALDGLPLQVTTGGSLSSVVAVLDGERPGPTVLLRADMDALAMPEDTDLEFRSEVDGAMHACGHDAHTAMLVGAARLLSQRRGELAGRVLFAFQPGEEGPGGAPIMIEEGLLDPARVGEVVKAFAIHQTPNIPTGMLATRAGALLAATDDFDVTVTGRGGHASSPHQALDPIPCTCEAITALQSHMTRRVDPFDPAVLSVTRLRAGTTSNVIPETARFGGTFRTVSAGNRERVRSGLRQVVEGVAAAHGCTAEVTIHEGYPVTSNDGRVAAWVQDLSAELVGPGASFEMPGPVMGSEDFSYILERVPGAMAFLGTCPPGTALRDVAPNHSNRMVLDEDAMAVGVALHALVALRSLAGDPQQN